MASLDWVVDTTVVPALEVLEGFGVKDSWTESDESVVSTIGFS